MLCAPLLLTGAVVDMPADWEPDIHAEYIDQVIKPVFTNTGTCLLTGNNDAF